MTEDQSRWRGKVALVTGASSGIGRAIAQTLGEMGMSLAVCARRSDRLEQLRQTIEGECLCLRVDMRSEEEIVGAFETIRERLGGVDVLVNNAGLGHKAPLLSGSTDEWREMLEVNVLALCIATREALSDMRRRGDDGHVVHIGSMAGHRVPAQASGVYTATKHAVVALTESLRRELHQVGSHIRVSAVSPGYVQTEFAEKYHKSRQMADATYSEYKVLQPQDVAATIRHLLVAPPHVQIHDVLMRPTRQQT